MSSRLPAGTSVGRVTLRVNDLDRQIEFYRDVVGAPTVDRADGQATLLADGEALFELIEAPDADERPRSAAGLFHAAVRVPDRSALGDVLARVRERWRLAGGSDHGVSEALYLSDPEGNGIEIYRDRPREDWDRNDGRTVEMVAEPLDRTGLFDGDADAALPSGSDMGHVHLEASALGASRSFYVDALGFDVSAAFEGQAAFLAAGNYHHHLGINVWNGRSAPTGDHRGIERFDVAVPDKDALAATAQRLEESGVTVERSDETLSVADPVGIGVRVVVDE
jgi:catechol 2,3-dioxygenase